MPDYIITPNPKTHEFKLTRIDNAIPEDYHLIVTLFPSAKCVAHITSGMTRCVDNRNGEHCIHIEAVERALIDARNAPEDDYNKLLIETAYIPLRVAHRRSQRVKKTMERIFDDESRTAERMD